MRESCCIFLFIIIFLWLYCLKKLIFLPKFVVSSRTWGEHEDSSPKGCWGAGCIPPAIKIRGKHYTRIVPNRQKCRFFTVFLFVFFNHSLLRVCKNSKHSTPSGTRTADPTRWTWCSCSWRGGGAGWLSAAHHQIMSAQPQWLRPQFCHCQTRGRVTGAETQYPAHTKTLDTISGDRNNKSVKKSLENDSAAKITLRFPLISKQAESFLLSSSLDIVLTSRRYSCTTAWKMMAIKK